MVRLAMTTPTPLGVSAQTNSPIRTAVRAAHKSQRFVETSARRGDISDDQGTDAEEEDIEERVHGSSGLDGKSHCRLPEQSTPATDELFVINGYQIDDDEEAPALGSTLPPMHASAAELRSVRKHLATRRSELEVQAARRPKLPPMQKEWNALHTFLLQKQRKTVQPPHSRSSSQFDNAVNPTQMSVEPISGSFQDQRTKHPVVLGGIRPLPANSRAQERARLEHDILNLRKKVGKRRPASHTEHQKLANLLGAYAMPAHAALGKVHGLTPEPPKRESNNNDQLYPKARRNGRSGGRLLSWRRSHSADPDSPSRRKTLEKQGFLPDDAGSLGHNIPSVLGRPPLPHQPVALSRAGSVPDTAGGASPRVEVSTPRDATRVLVGSGGRPPRPISAKSRPSSASGRPSSARPTSRASVRAMPSMKCLRNDDQDVPALHAAATLVQAQMKGWRARAKYKKERTTKLFALGLVAKWKQSRLSERNHLWAVLGGGFPGTTAAGCDFREKSVISAYLEKEGEESQRLQLAIRQTELSEAAIEEARQASRLDTIEQDEAMAQKEVAEMEEAEAKLRKEEAEAIDWKGRADGLEAEINKFQSALSAKGMAATPHEMQVLKNKLTMLQWTKSRAGREWDQFQYAHRIWVKERDEALAAVTIATKARKEWEDARAAYRHERSQRERNRLDMPFRDARRSVLQKLRACNLDPEDNANIVHPALPLAFFAKGHVNCHPVPPRDSLNSPRECRQIEHTVPMAGVSVVLANDGSRYEGDWDHLRHPGISALHSAFARANLASQNHADMAGATLPTSSPRESGCINDEHDEFQDMRLDAKGFQVAMKSLGRMVTAVEAEALIYYFDANENGTVFSKFSKNHVLSICS